MASSTRKSKKGSGYEIPEVEGVWVAMDLLFRPTGLSHLAYGRVMYTIRDLQFGTNRGWCKVEKLPDELPPFTSISTTTKELPCNSVQHSS